MSGMIMKIFILLLFEDIYQKFEVTHKLYFFSEVEILHMLHDDD